MSGLRYIFPLMFWAVQVGAQGTIGPEVFFAGANLLTGSESPLTGRARLRTPLIRAYDLRTVTRDFDTDRQEYTLRLNFSSPGLNRAQRALSEQQLRYPSVNLTEAVCEQVVGRYEAWAELYFLDRRALLLDSLLLVTDDRQRLAERYAASLEVDAEELLRIRTERTELQLDQRTVARDRRKLSDIHSIAKEQLLDFSRFPAFADLQDEVVRAGAPARDEVELAYELGLIDRELELERAEGNQLLDFLQFRYNSDPRDLLREKFSIGLAFRIQDSGDRRLKIQELQLEREQLATEGRLRSQLERTKISSDLVRLTTEMDHYRTLLIILNEEDADLRTIGAAVARLRGQDPSLELRINRRRINNRLRRLEAYRRVVEAYLGWREHRGELCRFDQGELLTTE